MRHSGRCRGYTAKHTGALFRIPAGKPRNLYYSQCFAWQVRFTPPSGRVRMSKFGHTTRACSTGEQSDSPLNQEKNPCADNSPRGVPRGQKCMTRKITPGTDVTCACIIQRRLHRPPRTELTCTLRTPSDNTASKKKGVTPMISAGGTAKRPGENTPETRPKHVCNASPSL